MLSTNIIHMQWTLLSEQKIRLLLRLTSAYAVFESDNVVKPKQTTATDSSDITTLICMYWRSLLTNSVSTFDKYFIAHKREIKKL